MRSPDALVTEFERRSTTLHHIADFLSDVLLLKATVLRDNGATLGFVFNANRINVATSRAQCRLELVCSPRLLEADCRSIEEMRLVNALCRFVELAQS